MFLRQVFLIFVLFSYLGLHASPEASFWHREVMWGINNKHYYILSFERTNPDSYYEFTDSVFVVRKSILNNQVVERKFIYAIQHRDTTSNGDWKADFESKNSDLLEYLLKKRVVPAYRHQLPYRAEFVVAEDGLYIENGEGSELLLDNKQIIRQVGEDFIDGETCLIQQSYFFDEHYLLGVKSGTGDYDLDYHLRFITVKSVLVDEKLEELNKSIEAADKVYMDEADELMVFEEPEMVTGEEVQNISPDDDFQMVSFLWMIIAIMMVFVIALIWTLRRNKN